MTKKNELTPGEILMQEIGLALLKYTNYELGAVKVVETTEVEIEVEDDAEEAPVTPAKRSRKPKETPMALEEDEGEDEEEGTLTKADLEGKTIRQLRTIAINMGFLKDDVKDADKESLIISIIDPAGDDEDDEDEEDADEAPAEESEIDTDALTAKFEKLTLPALKKVAREEYGFKAPDYKDMDKDAVIELILEKIDGSDVEDDDDDDDDAPYTEDELNEMPMSELKAICKEWGVKIKIGEKKPAHVKAILDAQED